MENVIEVRKDVYVKSENLAFYEENNFTPLFELAENINEKIESIENMLDTVISRHSSKIHLLQTEAAKEQWYTEALRDLTQTNQALFGVMMLLNDKIND